jgi:Flp pilus assembly protein TadG
MKNFIPISARRRRDSGQVMVLFVLLMIVLILFIGLGIDLGFSYITRANLSKSVDAAALLGAMNLSNGTNTAQSVALSAFDMNYGVSSRDAAAPDVTVQVFNDANNNLTVDVSASVNINTYFIRVLPQWSTLAVASTAEAVRNNVIMTLVLDTSGSMDPSRGPPPGGNGTGSGGGQFLPGAVTDFINNFDEKHDQAAMVSFNTIQSNVFFGGTLAQPQPTQPFKSPIINAVNAFAWTGYTFSQGGLTNALVIENNAAIPPGQSAVKIVVFCTDGRANVIQDTFDCPPSTTWNYGGKDSCSGDGVHFFDPITGANPCDVAVDGGTPSCCGGASEYPSAKFGSMQLFTCDGVTAESQFRAIQVANQMRQAGIIVYSIGVGSGLTPDLDFLSFLQQVANDPNAPGYVATSHDGEAVVANDPSQLKTVFQQIASKILLRLAK